MIVVSDVREARRLRRRGDELADHGLLLAQEARETGYRQDLVDAAAAAYRDSVVMLSASSAIAARATLTVTVALLMVLDIVLVAMIVWGR